MNAPSAPDDAHFFDALASVTSHPSASILCALSQGGCRQAELTARVEGLHEATVAVNLRALDAEGFVARRVDPGPPLRVIYELTSAGTTLAASLRTLQAVAPPPSR